MANKLSDELKDLIRFGVPNPNMLDNPLINFLENQVATKSAFGSDVYPYLLVSSVEDLPAPTGDEYILPENTLVLLNGMVDLGSRALRYSAGTTVRGLNPGLDGILTMNTTSALRATNIGRVIAREFSIVAPAGAALDLEGGPDEHLNLFFVAFFSCLSGGSITGFKVQALKDCYTGQLPGFGVPQDGFTFHGTTSKTYLFGSPFEELGAGAAIRLASDLNSSVVDITGNFFKFDSNAVGLEVEAGAQVGEGTYTRNLILGTATPLAGVSQADVNWWMELNTGIRQSRILGQESLTDAPGTETFITAGVPVHIDAITTASPDNERFVSSGNNRLTIKYPGESLVTLTGTFSLGSSRNNTAYTAYLAVNGQVIPASRYRVRVSTGGEVRSGICTAVVPMFENDYVEMWLANETNTTSVDVIELSLSARG